MDVHSFECLDFPRIREIVAGYALTGLGRSLAANVRPIARIALVRRWLTQVQELRHLVEERGTPPFADITDIRPILPRCAPPLRVTVEEVAQIGRALAGTHAVTAYLQDLPEDTYPEIRHVASRVGDFQSVADRISTVIDDRGRVRDNASPKLRDIRAQIEDAQQQTHRTIERLLRDPAVRRLLQYPNHTFHGDRLVLPLRAECRGRITGIVHRTSDSGGTLYVEPSGVVELNNHISNLRSAEQEEIGRLLWDLAHEIHLNGREIHTTFDALAVIDLITAKVRFARAFEAHCPELAEDGTFNVRGARHPLLLDLARRKRLEGEPPGDVVPIDYRIGHDFDLLIVTGPNTGGKTVTLKTIGLLSLMVQAGLPVPVADGSEMGIFSNVLIDVGDEQSMQQSLSTFSAHLTRILDMLRHAGPRALLLIDELGAGTDPDEGAAIGRAILDELLRLHCRGVVTTHLGALKGFALTRPRAENACVDFDSQTLEPTYHLCLGEPGHSNAIEVAQRLGMSKRMVMGARRNLSRKARALHAALESTRTVKREAEDARRMADKARLLAGEAEGEATAARDRLERQRADFELWVQRVVHLQPGDPVRVRNFDRDGKIIRLRLEQQRAEVDVGSYSVEVPLGDVLPPQTPAPPPRPPRKPAAPATPPPPKLRRPAPAKTPPAAVRPEHTPKSKAAPEVPSLTDEQAAALKPLDSVFVKRFHREGRVVRVKPGKKTVVITVGMLEVEVPFDGLGHASRRDQRPSLRTTSSRRPRQQKPDRPAAQPAHKSPPPEEAESSSKLDADGSPPSSEPSDAS